MTFKFRKRKTYMCPERRKQFRLAREDAARKLAALNSRKER